MTIGGTVLCIRVVMLTRSGSMIDRCTHCARWDRMMVYIITAILDKLISTISTKYHSSARELF